ncbi:MAG: hypothetical protein H7210_01025 [Pyrinomonadaceae bacterium]|nr:hypothetical protein [Phycisphaerales bacterium]
MLACSNVGSLRRHWLVLTLCASTLCFAGAALGQRDARKSPPPKPPAAPKAAPVATPAQTGTVAFADDPLRIDSVGMTVQIPVGSVTSVTTVGDRRNVAIIPMETNDAAKEVAWIINVTTPKTSNPAVGIKESLDQIVALLQGSVGVTDAEQKTIVSTQAEVLERTDDLTLQGQVAGRVYVRIPDAKNKKIVKGFTIFNPSPKQFVMFELVTASEAYERSKPTYELIVATATFRDASAMNTDRALAIKAGARIMSELSEADYVAAMGTKELWQRLYVPAQTGSDDDAQEIGYRGLYFWRGRRGEVNPELPRSKWSDADNQEGYLAKLTVRLLDSVGAVGANDKHRQTAFIDTVAVYFMTPDRREETWSVRMVKRDVTGKDLGRWTETGARLGNEVTVLVGETKDGGRPIVAPFDPEGYICQVESYMLPTIMVKAGMKANTDKLEAGFYTYRTENEAVSFRRDILKADPQRAGTWTMTSRVRDEGQPQTYVFNGKGDLIRTELADGRLWEPVEIEWLYKLWQRKGLPTEIVASKPARKTR